MRSRSMLILGLLAVLLQACAIPNAPTVTIEPTQPSADTGPIRIGFGGLDFERPAYQPVIDAFNAANADLQVEFVPLESLLQGGGLNNIARQVAESADTFVSMLADRDPTYLADLRPLMDADASFDQADFQPGALPSGPLKVLPSTISVQTVSYNQDLWNAAGLATPAASWSWNDLLAAAEHLTRRQGDITLVYGLNDGQDGRLVLQGLLIEAGVSLAPGADGSLNLDQPEVAAVLTRVADLIERGVIFQRPAAGGLIGPDVIGKEIRDGQVAMWLGGSFLFGRSGSETPDLAVTDAALPSLPRDSILSSRGYAMSIGAAHPEAAWRWLSYLSRQTISFGGGLVFFGLGYDIPARQSLADTARFWEGLPADRAAVLRATLARAQTLPPPASEQLRDNLGSLLQAVLGGTPVAQAVIDANTRLSEQLLDRAKTPTPGAATIQVQLPDPVVVPESATRINFGSFVSDPAAIRQLAKQFHQQQSGVYVELVPPSFGGGEFSIAAATNGLDCFAWPDPPSSADRSNLLDLQPLLDLESANAAAQPMRDDYPAQLLAPFGADGRLYGLPYAVNLRALNYNRDAFNAAGLEAPRADWSLDQFLEAARRLTDKREADPQYGYSIAGGVVSDLLAFLSWQDAQLVSGSASTRTLQFTDPKVVQALRSYIELLRDYSPHTSLPGYRSDSLFGGAAGLGQAGQIGMWYSSGFEGIVVRIDGGSATTPPDLAVAPPPVGRHGLTNADYTTSGLYISAASAHPDACFEWLRFLSQQISGLGQQFPARTSVATSAAFLSQARPGAAELYAAYAAALNQPTTAAERYDGVDLFWLLQALDKALQGGNLDQELAKAQSFTEQYLACTTAGESPESCAKSVDPDYQGGGPLTR